MHVLAGRRHLGPAAHGRRAPAARLFHIRRYAQACGASVLEVGRSSETGPGSFVFRTREAAALQRVMAEYDLNRHSAAPDLPCALPPPPPPPTPLETQTLGRLGKMTKKQPAIAKLPRKAKSIARAEPLSMNLWWFRIDTYCTSQHTQNKPCINAELIISNWLKDDTLRLYEELLVMRAVWLSC